MEFIVSHKVIFLLLIYKAVRMVQGENDCWTPMLCDDQPTWKKMSKNEDQMCENNTQKLKERISSFSLKLYQQTSKVRLLQKNRNMCDVVGMTTNANLPRKFTRCSEYVQSVTNVTQLSNVTIYSDDKFIEADCTILPEVKNVTEFSIAVPTNSLVARTLMIQAIFRYRDFMVNYTDENENIYFHTSIRRNGIVARNSLQSGFSWEKKEDRDLDWSFSYRTGELHEFNFTADNNAFHCTVDGKKLFDFKHRYRPLSKITRIKLKGATFKSISYN